MITLNEVMEFDHPVEVLPGGSVVDAPDGIYAPDVTVDDNPYRLDVEGFRDQRWTLLTGYTGQYSYNGPIMHPSEVIGGQMEDDIRETPGVYVVVEVREGIPRCGAACGKPVCEFADGIHHLATDGESADVDADADHEAYEGDEPVGWAVARLAEEEYRQINRAWAVVDGEAVLPNGECPVLGRFASEAGRWLSAATHRRSTYLRRYEAIDAN